MRDAGVPLHRQLYLVLHDEIGRGALAAGEALPTEQSLCDQFGVSRITVRRALADLAEAGLIERRHGVGSFVTEQSPRRPRRQRRSYLDEHAAGRVRDRGRRDRVRRPAHCRPRWCARLRTPRPARCTCCACDANARTGEPLMVTEAWLPAELADVVTETALARRAARTGCWPTRA